METVKQPRISGFGLGLMVFAAGAAMMCFEIVGGLTIAPHFGSNVFVWGSIISVFMGALSLGYAVGGKAADRGFGPLLLPALLGAAGALVLLVPWLAPLAARVLLEAHLPPALAPIRPLAAACALFFVPTVLLGMVSPLAVRAASTALTSVGRVVGALYALNTVGSVAGALLSTFVLVVFFGNRAIMVGCGIALILAAAVGARLSRGATRAAAAPSPDVRGGPDARTAPGLRPMVFACGAVLMSLEVVGGAEIAPYFGSSVFVWGSVITVFLGALTAGYRVGGRLADRRPTMGMLSALVAAAGVCTLLVPLAAPAICKAASALPLEGLNILRPFFAAAVLYALPIFLFATVAPFAVRLSAGRVGAVGGVAGRLYALSTLGNLVGALLTTFVLISAFGKTRLFELGGVIAVAAAMQALFASGRAAYRKPRPLLASALLVFAVSGFVLAPKPALVALTDSSERAVGSVAGWTLVGQEDSAGHYLLRRIRAERESPYHHIAVIEEKELPVGQAVRTDDGRSLEVASTSSRGCRRDLRFDRYVESSVLLDVSGETIWEPYTSGTTYSDMLHLPLIFNPEPREVLIIGGGGGVVPMIFRKFYPQVAVDVVEIDPVVVEAAQEWFGLTPDDRVRVHVQDGRMFVHNSKRKYDVIILDAYTAGGRIPFHLLTREFLAQVRSRLSPEGVVLLNVISPVSGPRSKLFRAGLKTMRDVFGAEHVYAFPKILQDFWDPSQSTNVMLVATVRGGVRRLTHQEVSALAERLHREGKVPLETLPKHAANMLTDTELTAIPLDDVPVLTDDYAPVDVMVVHPD